MNGEAIEELDVLVVGAGLSGIAAGYHLQRRCPGERYAILESREAIGGTWDLFRYPGVRSDSDMFTLGYSFRPWASDAQIAAGPAIRDYIRETASAFGIDRHIRFGHRVTGAEWDSQQARWTLSVHAGGAARTLRCRFLFFCSGYYDYEKGHAPDWPGRERFQGRVVHPQHWPADLDWSGRKVVVIGSGATAVTLVPAMAEAAAHVTMLQRSPSYVLALPARDPVGAFARRWLPGGVAHRAIRWKNILGGLALFQFARRRPQAARRWLLRDAQRRAGPAVDVATHFAPRYDPWDQRLCIAPDADLFEVLRSGRASVVTGEIDRFTPAGIRLASGEELQADIVVSATGLKLQMLGGAALVVDGRPVDLSQSLSYKGVMFGGVPNLALAMGYTNASWTLKSELIARQVCRLLRAMRSRGADICVPVPPAAGQPTRPAIDLSAGYVQRAAASLPRQGSSQPWRIHQNYLRDLITLRLSPLADGALRFAPSGAPLPGSFP